MHYIDLLTRPPSTVCSRFIWPINSINTSESRKFEAEVHSYFVRPTFDGRHNISLGCYQGPRDVLLALSPFAVDSLTPSYRHSQHPPRAPIPHHFSQLLQAKSSFTCMPIPVPASISFIHLFLGCLLLLYPILYTPSSPSSDRPLSSRDRRTTSVIIYYVATIGLLPVIPVSLHCVFRLLFE